MTCVPPSGRVTMPSFPATPLPPVGAEVPAGRSTGGHAEDTAWIVSLAQSVTSPTRPSTASSRLLNGSPLEPNVIEKKYYVSGIGMVPSVSAAGENERAELVRFTKP